MGVLELIQQFEKISFEKTIKRNCDSLFVRYGELESLWR